MCKHISQVGDNYGVSCAACGEKLHGYGYGGWFGRNITGTEQCKHVWSPFGDMEVCVYCEEMKPTGEPKSSPTKTTNA